VIILDASVLIGFLDGADAHHASAEAFMASAMDDNLAVNPLTLAEVLVVPARDGRLADVLAVLHDLEVEELAFPSDAASRLAQLRAQTRLKMPDCCVLLSAVAAGAGVASLDDRLRAAAQRQGLPTVGARPAGTGGDPVAGS
jgi:predicted nucleic acid-binding protein